MEAATFVDVLEAEGRSLVADARDAGLEATVPSCPGWRVEDLLAHVGFVHRGATAYVRTALAEMVDTPGEAVILQSAPPAAERIEWVSAGHAALVRALRGAPTDLECWTFLAAPSPLAMWARRQAHETAVHAVDAALAAGRGAPGLEPAFAADGIDELLFAFFGRDRRDPGRGDGVISLEATDRPLAWTVRVSEEAVTAERGLGHSDVHVRATASDLYLLLWHRRPLEGMDLRGTPADFTRLWPPTGVRWQ